MYIRGIDMADDIRNKGIAQLIAERQGTTPRGAFSKSAFEKGGQPLSEFQNVADIIAAYNDGGPIVPETEYEIPVMAAQWKGRAANRDAQKDFKRQLAMDEHRLDDEPENQIGADKPRSDLPDMDESMLNIWVNTPKGKAWLAKIKAGADYGSREPLEEE